MIYKQFYVFIGVLIFFSFFSYTSYNILPANIILEFLVLISFLLVGKRASLKAWMIITVSLVYILTTLFIAYFNDVHLKDYLLAYKTFFYLILISFFSGKILFEKKHVIQFFHFILFSFLLKYILWIFIAEFDRPGVLTENNFELLFLLLFSLAVYSSTGRLSKIELFLLVIVFFLSGSRSGIISFFSMLCILYIRSFSFKTIYTIIFLSFFAVGGVVIFIERLSGGTFESIDRFVFLQSFIIAISNWNFSDYLIGSSTLTALPSEVCRRLSFYETLFSASDPNVCYSAVLHSYILRVIFDHGIIGFLFIFYSLWLLMRLSLVPSRVTFSVITILFLNGLSVSSFNSVYAILGFIFLLTVQKENYVRISPQSSRI